MVTQGSKYRGSTQFLKVYAKLIEAAQGGGVVTYKQVARILGITEAGHHMAREVGQVLGEISEDEHGHGRPMLSALAVSEAGMPGPGFWTLARRLGKTVGDGTTTEVQFWAAEQAAVYTTWQ